MEQQLEVVIDPEWMLSIFRQTSELSKSIKNNKNCCWSQIGETMRTYLELMKIADTMRVIEGIDFDMKARMNELEKSSDPEDRGVKYYELRKIQEEHWRKIFRVFVLKEDQRVLKNIERQRKEWIEWNEWNEWNKSRPKNEREED